MLCREGMFAAPPITPRSAAATLCSVVDPTRPRLQWTSVEGASPQPCAVNNLGVDLARVSAYVAGALGVATGSHEAQWRET